MLKTEEEQYVCLKIPKWPVGEQMQLLHNTKTDRHSAAGGFLRHIQVCSLKAFDLCYIYLLFYIKY